MKKWICIGLLVILFIGILTYSLWPKEFDCTGPGPTYPFFYFYSIEEYLMYFEENAQTGVVPAVEENRINYRPERGEISAEYTAFVEKMISEPVIYMPTYHGEFLRFQNKEGFYNVDLLTRWTDGLPWVRYSLLSEKGPLTVEILYSNNFQVASGCQNLREKEIVLSDRTVSAFIEEKQNGGIAVSFPYDEIYVVLRAKEEVLTDQWLKGLSFSKYTGAQWIDQSPMRPTADGLVCNNDVFVGLECSTIEQILYLKEEGNKETKEINKFVKLLKEETLTEVTAEEHPGYTGATFEIIFKNGKKETVSIYREYLFYNDHIYIDVFPDLIKQLRALFNL